MKRIVWHRLWFLATVMILIAGGLRGLDLFTVCVCAGAYYSTFLWHRGWVRWRHRQSGAPIEHPRIHRAPPEGHHGFSEGGGWLPQSFRNNSDSAIEMWSPQTGHCTLAPGETIRVES